MQIAPRRAMPRAASAPRRFVMPGRWCVELLPPSPYNAVYTAETPIIGFAFEAQTGMHAFGSDRRAAFRSMPNGLAYVPAGCDVYSRSDSGGEYLKITLACEPSAFRKCARRFSDAIDHAAIAAAHDLRRHLLLNDIDLLRCERSVQALSERVGLALQTTTAALAACSSMTQRRLRLVDDLIEARLDAKLTVQELATAVGLSAGFFSRAFKATVGKAPYDYIVDRRISRARRLLANIELDLTTIAHASGFASHAHMTTTFRDRLGISPSVLRRR